MSLIPQRSRGTNTVLMNFPFGGLKTLLIPHKAGLEESVK